jgi:cysteine desulfurase
VNPIEQIATTAHENGSLLHVDAVQALGRLPIDLTTLPVDLMTVSAHKIYGPKGVGALVLRSKVPFVAPVTGGHQERGRRAGTENVAGIVGFGAALGLVDVERGRLRVGALRERLEQGLASIPGVTIVGDGAPRLWNTVNACFEGLPGEALLMGLDLEGVCASAGSACTSGSLEPSHVLLAMGLPARLARGAVRFSLGRGNTEAEIDRTLGIVTRLAASLRAVR